MKPVVYFTKEITPDSVKKLFSMLQKELPGKVAVKVHSGEPGNQNFLRPEFWKDVVKAVTEYSLYASPAVGQISD